GPCTPWSGACIPGKVRRRGKPPDSGGWRRELVTPVNVQEEELEGSMLRWAAIFLIISLVAAILGFGGISAAAAGIAKILFFVFIVLFLIALIAGLSIGK